MFGVAESLYWQPVGVVVGVRGGATRRGGLMSLTTGSYTPTTRTVCEPLMVTRAPTVSGEALCPHTSRKWGWQRGQADEGRWQMSTELQSSIVPAFWVPETCVFRTVYEVGRARASHLHLTIQLSATAFLRLLMVATSPMRNGPTLLN